MKKLLEIRIPISPTPFFFRRVHFLVASLRRLGGALADDLEFTVCVGGDVDPYNLYDAQPWSTRYPVTWRWVSRHHAYEQSRELHNPAPCIRNSARQDCEASTTSQS